MIPPHYETLSKKPQNTMQMHSMEKAKCCLTDSICQRQMLRGRDGLEEVNGGKGGLMNTFNNMDFFLKR